ncbi:hypothetical protein NDU88_007558 [Pleurodeles waltl]|uniref:Uncharacterized protein n=1 Tax=Pleurodeles waltl TaxID=8319 RepID=A0AAV7WHZ0_PLEWA|nr:hypothetical protein NDU88_007558 [Pleurodeles waltl]
MENERSGHSWEGNRQEQELGQRLRWRSVMTWKRRACVALGNQFWLFFYQQLMKARFPHPVFWNPSAKRSHNRAAMMLGTSL